ncbi:AMP-dependent synthetase [Aeromicrobium sp. PE09-221]|uniref:long-chain-fatty-acid--CoA ligase n=1 Tax=Aeromicrobium sp. PE09-221 TaxID=1898043 RepID=UPI000B3ED258|nr:long-chain fatty acid--CoA ligase [Aeromicrobium sp. PE09-221]OUZ06455.1 AMP-dependent synthetase [Aeromicrobium sp. PE09-221]
MVNITGRVWEIARSSPEQVALRSPREVTYGQLRTANRRVAGAIEASGRRPHGRVLLIAPSVPEFPEVYYGLHAAGCTVVTMNTMSTAHEIGYVLDDSGADLVIVWREHAQAASNAARERDVEVWVLSENAELAGAPAVPGEVTEAFDHDPEDTVVILYTSGTTGRPKGAELTAANLVDTADSFRPVLNLTREDRLGTALPLFHVFGQAACMNTFLAQGASLSLVHPFDPDALLRLMRDERLTALAGVPTMWNAMLHAPTELAPGDVASMRVALSGGASLPAEVIERFADRFGCAILEGYGLTESTGAATFNDINREQRAGTVGPALPGTSLQVRRPDGTLADEGEVGEVFLSGPTVMKGYWNNPEATAAALDDGWLRTGDLGSLDADGYLRIVDRSKDLIIRGGYNVYPREVEEVLYRHPDIVEVAVVGVPDDYYGEEVAAVVVGSPGSALDGEQITRWAKDYLSSYKVPRVFSFVDQLPKGATGKILKRSIDREALVAGRE